MGFNAMQPGKARKGDLLMLLAAVVAIVGALVWALR
jgi:hypothetical protein